MVYKREQTEKNATMQVAELMAAAARTAPKTRGIDGIETLILDGEDKAKLVATLRKIGANDPTYERDASNLEKSHCIMLIATDVAPRGVNCGFCGVPNCAEAAKANVVCALAMADLGIATGSAAAVAMDNRIDNRVFYKAGRAALEMKLFSDKVTASFGFGLATTGKSIFFDRP